MRYRLVNSEDIFSIREEGNIKDRGGLDNF